MSIIKNNIQKSEDVLKLLQRVTCDCKDNGEEFIIKDRVSVIKEYLKDSSYNLLVDDKLFLLYGKKPLLPGDSVVLISSHIDCVYQHCFCKEKDEFYHGTFDNSFTNAVLLRAMLNECLPDNVVVAFTGDEEHDSAGAIAVNVYLTKNQNPIRFALVLDVTNAGWEQQHLFSIENDLGIDLLTAYRIVDALKPYEGKYTFLHQAEPDETWDYDEYGIPCMTLSAPVGGNMHADQGVYVRKLTFIVYMEALVILIKALTQ